MQWIKLSIWILLITVIVHYDISRGCYDPKNIISSSCEISTSYTPISYARGTYIHNVSSTVSIENFGTTKWFESSVFSHSMETKSNRTVPCYIVDYQGNLTSNNIRLKHPMICINEELYIPLSNIISWFIAGSVLLVAIFLYGYIFNI